MRPRWACHFSSDISRVVCTVLHVAISWFAANETLGTWCALACPRTASRAARWGHSCGGRQLRWVTALALRLDSQRHLHAGNVHAPARSTCSLCSSGARAHSVRRCELSSHLVRFGSGPVALMSPLPCLDLRTRSPSVPWARKRGPDIARDTTDSNTIRQPRMWQSNGTKRYQVLRQTVIRQFLWELEAEDAEERAAKEKELTALIWLGTQRWELALAAYAGLESTGLWGSSFIDRTILDNVASVSLS